MSTPEAPAVLDLLASHEDALSRLYTAYALRFPQEADFWANLAGDETVHAGWLRSLANASEAGSVLVTERFHAPAIRLSLKHIEEQTGRAEDPALTLMQALSTAVDLETALLEKCSFQVFATDSPRFTAVIAKLVESTREHARYVRERWEQHRQQLAAVA